MHSPIPAEPTVMVATPAAQIVQGGDYLTASIIATDQRASHNPNHQQGRTNFSNSMKKVLAGALLSLLLGLAIFSYAEARSVGVRGHFRSNGSYVQPHYRTSPNRSRFDNWSTKGNFNPYTGKKGTADPFKLRFR